ncbi:MAG: polyprenyl synthetase family protein [Oligoflexia bacterium]|nr:polyprenyl synthetase family protein [Oligoflexia bacterium]
MFQEKLSQLKSLSDQYVGDYIASIQDQTLPEGAKKLVESMAYSLTAGGHRIRPALCALVAEALERDPKTVLPFACGVELIHTYSLIHDDLPCMDDDDFRRGKPSNHKVFGESVAVLAGDAMSTEAFRTIADGYAHDPDLALKLIRLLAEASGPHGLAGGQAIDLLMRDRDLTESELELLHSRKTGVLFRATVVGAALICESTTEQMRALEEYSKVLGLVFQISDDISDGEQTGEPSFVKAAGLKSAQETCKSLILRGHEALVIFGDRGLGLKSLLSYVYERTQAS